MKTMKLRLITRLYNAGGRVRRLVRCCTQRTGWWKVAGGTDGSLASCQPTYTRGWRALSTSRHRCQFAPPRRVLSRNDNTRSLLLLPQPPTRTRGMMRPDTSSSSLPVSTTSAAAATSYIYNVLSETGLFIATRRTAGRLHGHLHRVPKRVPLNAWW